MATGTMWLNAIVYPNGDVNQAYPANINVLSTAMPPPRPVGPGDSPNPQPPLGIWGPTDPRPWNPISGIPGIPGYEPPQLPSTPPTVVKEVPEGGGWGAAEVDGKLVWVYVPGESTAGPKK